MINSFSVALSPTETGRESPVGQLSRERRSRAPMVVVPRNFISRKTSFDAATPGPMLLAAKSSDG